VGFDVTDGAHASLRISTGELPEKARATVWIEQYAREVLRLDAEIEPDVPFNADLTLSALPDLSIISGSISPCRLNRTPGLLADGRDNLFLQCPRGPMRLYQRGREVLLEAGDAALISSGETGGVEFSDSDVTVISLSHAPLESRLRDPGSALMRQVPRGTETMRLLNHYLSAPPMLMTATRALQRTYVDHVYDLVALTLGATRDAAEVAKGRGLAAARMHAIKNDALANFQKTDLTVGAVAKRQGVTPRYIQMLFEAEGTTFSQFLREQRLAQAYRMLCHPRYDGLLISTIAYDIGFSDLSHFNRAFRERYGMTPSDARQARRENGGGPDR
jgi:AraC-like DNA-binding protein